MAAAAAEKTEIAFRAFCGKRRGEGRENWAEKTHKQETGILDKIFQIEYQVFESFEDNSARE